MSWASASLSPLRSWASRAVMGRDWSIAGGGDLSDMGNSTTLVWKKKATQEKRFPVKAVFTSATKMALLRIFSEFSLTNFPGETKDVGLFFPGTNSAAKPFE